MVGEKMTEQQRSEVVAGSLTPADLGDARQDEAHEAQHQAQENANREGDETGDDPRADSASTSRPAEAQHEQAPHQHPSHKRQHRNRKQMAEAPSSAPDQQVPVSADYLAQLIKDKKQLSAFPSVFMHVQRLIDEEIHKVRQSLFQLSDVVHQSAPLELPEPEGEPVQLQEKIYVPVEEHPEYNFVGRLLGPRGMTAKQLEQESGCKIMIRGRGSMRDKKKEEQNRGKANWEHLNDELHVLITVEDSPNRAQVKMRRALEEVRQLLKPVLEGEDELKKRQLMELAIINGTYRDCNYNEALSKMLHETGYPTAGASEQLNGLPAPASGQRPQQPQFLGQVPSTPVNGSSVSSGVPSTGSNTPNSVQGLQGPQRHSLAGQPPASPYLSSSSAAAAVVAAAAAAAAQHQQQQHHLASPPQQHHHHPSLGGLPMHPAGSPAHHHAHALASAASNHLHHGSPAAVAAAAALMSNPDALMYAQQYHDFHHYAAMVVAAQPLLAPDYAHHAHLPPTHQHQSSQQAYQQQQVDLRAPPSYQQQPPMHRYHQGGASKDRESENGNDMIDPSAAELEKAQQQQYQLADQLQQPQQQASSDLCGS